MGGRMSEEERRSAGGPGSSWDPEAESDEADREEVVTTGAPAEDLEPGPDESGDEFGEEFDPFDDDLSPWYGDLAGDVRPPEAADKPSQDVPAPDNLQTGACPDADGPASRAEELRSSLYVPPLLDEGVPAPSYGRRRRGRRLVRRDEKSSRFFTPEQRLLLLDTWQRSARS
jgi:hypothetical protein